MPALALERTEVALASTYGLIAEWLLYPEVIDPSTLEDDAVEAALSSAETLDPEIARLINEFHSQRHTVSAEEYIGLMELNPRCPLYVGHYIFEEPKTCSAAGMSDRNTFMMEINNIYAHFAFELRGELPDFLPVMTEFLALTADCDEDDREVRARLIEKLMIAGLQELHKKLQKADVPYKHLIKALLICIEKVEGLSVDEAPEETEKALPMVDKQLIQIEEAPTSG